MHPKMTAATAKRVLRQLSHDPRTIGLLFVVPSVLLGLLAWIYSDTPLLFDAIGAPLLGIFPFIVMFLITSVTTLRERSSGTLERLLAMPIGKLDIILGYALAFGAIAIVQATIVSFLAVHAFGLNVAGPEWLLIVVALADALLGMALGLFVSAFATTEFQAVQFLPALVLPQFLLCGLLVPVDSLPNALHYIAECLPLTYAVEAMQHITSDKTIGTEAYGDIAIVLAFATAAILLGGATLRRKTK
jgi:ABC-type multidrug transport system, permease component